MKATEANLLQFLKKSPQFVIPIYQRNYSWTEAQCRQLWDDIMRAGRNKKINAHFIGSIVYVERGLSTVTAQEALLVIDGQQRLTTTTLLIAALAEHFETHGLQEINLTLTGYNSEYSDRPFAYKRDQAIDQNGQPVGLATSPLHLNQGLGSVHRWDEEAIKQRALRLAHRAVKVWPAPQLENQILDTYRAVRSKPAQDWSINDHPYLLTGPTRDLFQALRQSILALDPCVNEEFLKLYVAYKAETNFVDIVPQAKRLRLSLNMPFHEVDDPENLCKDVSGLGRWGNGDVEVGFAAMNELPYIMSLIRQSFDRQMSEVQDT